MATSFNNPSGQYNGVVGTYTVAQQFTLNQHSTVSSVDLSLENIGQALSNLTVEILGDSSNTPGAVLATSTGATGTFNSSFNDISFALGGVSLNAGTYWVELMSSDASGNTLWQTQTQGINNSISTGNITDYIYNSSSGAFSNLNYTFLTTVNGTAATPEPSAFVMLLGGLATLGISRHRRCCHSSERRISRNC